MDGRERKRKAVLGRMGSARINKDCERIGTRLVFAFTTPQAGAEWNAWAELDLATCM